MDNTCHRKQKTKNITTYTASSVQQILLAHTTDIDYINLGLKIDIDTTYNYFILESMWIWLILILDGRSIVIWKFIRKV